MTGATVNRAGPCRPGATAGRASRRGESAGDHPPREVRTAARPGPTRPGAVVPRRGQALVLLVPLLLAFFAVAALVIDLGLVRVTQGRMATATDAASLEAVRWRDQLPPAATGTDLDANRRAAADALITTEFSTGFDAGPVVAETHVHATGPADVDAGAVLTPAETGYQPFPQPNAANVPSGDVVAGTYAPDPSAAVGDVVNGRFVAYAPVDFTPDPAGTTPPSRAALVRLRRGTGAAEEGVSSVGPSLPLLFGRGAAIGGAEAGSAYSVRRDGFAVRATSIATAAPACFAGPPIAGTDVQGAMAVVLLRSAWANRATLPPAPSQGQVTPVPVTVAGDLLLIGGTVVGHSTAAAVTTIGSPADVGGAVPATAVTGYFPIVDDTMTPPRVVGFGWATLDPAVGTLAKRATAGGSVAPWNASANLRDAWAVLAPLDAATRAAVRTANADLTDPVLAPASVRAVRD